MTPLLAISTTTELVILGSILAFAVAVTAFWIWALVDCARRIRAGDTRLVLWLIAIAFTQLVGAAFYIFCAPRDALAKTEYHA